MIDLFGHLFYIILAAGIYLLTKKNRWGWVCNMIAMLGFIVIGAMVELYSIAIWSGIFAIMYIYSFMQWSKK